MSKSSAICSRGRHCPCSEPTARRLRERLHRASSGSPAWRSTIQPVRRRPNAGNERIGDDGHAFAARMRQQRVAHIACALRFRKQLARFRLLDERQRQLRFEERDLLAERPRAHDAAQQMRRRVGDKARLVEPRGKDVAASAAADQNLAAAVSSCVRRAASRPARTPRRSPPSCRQRRRRLRRRAACFVGLAERQVETAGELELCRSGARSDARHAVIAQPRRPAEDERIAGFESEWRRPDRGA